MGARQATGRAPSGSVIGKKFVRVAVPATPGGSEAEPTPGTEQSGASSDPIVTAANMPAVLANGLRRLMGESQQLCRLRRVSATVPLVEWVRGDGKSRRLSVEGVATCKSSMCPLCVGKWQRIRCADIKQALDFWEDKPVLFFTGTMSHHVGMNLALNHRLLTKGYGEMWSGRKGQKFAELLGGKPESIRAHDATLSLEHGWHLHIHSLMFFLEQRYTVPELQAMMDDRWRKSLTSALRSFKEMTRKLLTREPCRVHERFQKRRLAGRAIDDSCSACIFGSNECPNNRDRAKKMFGSKLIKRHVPLLDSVRFVANALKSFTAKNIRPSEAHGVRVERVERDEQKVGNYLVKLGAMGFELANATGKLGREDERGVWHYSVWEVALLATRHRDPRRAPCRDAWRDLFKARFATQTITFSSRDRLGLGPDMINEEAPELNSDPGETSRVVGEIEGLTYDGMARSHQHGLIVTLMAAHGLGVLGELSFVHEPNGWHGVPSTHDPPERGPPRVSPEVREEQWRVLREAARVKGQEAWDEVISKLDGSGARMDSAFARGARSWRYAMSTLSAVPVPEERRPFVVTPEQEEAMQERCEAARAKDRETWASVVERLSAISAPKPPDRVGDTWPVDATAHEPEPMSEEEKRAALAKIRDEHPEQAERAEHSDISMDDLRENLARMGASRSSLRHWKPVPKDDGAALRETFEAIYQRDLAERKM